MKSGYISIIGRPNSGKSTLLNRIIGEELSIVTHKPQTTRHKIVGIYNAPGAQMVFLDTPGYHQIARPLNQYMMEQIDVAIKDADVVCWVEDASSVKERGWKKDEFFSSLPSSIVPGRIAVAISKLDLVLDRPWGNLVSEYMKLYGDYTVLGISAKTGYGISELIEKFTELLPEGEPFYPDDLYTEHSLRFLSAELIRQQVLLNMHQEIPYSVAVEIEQYKEEEGIHRIHAAIIVERDSQKGMLIGRGGHMIKKIGELARARIETLVGAKVFLKLFVKVEKNWTKDLRLIKQIL